MALGVLIVLTDLCVQWAAAVALRRRVLNQIQFSKEIIAFVASRCSCLPGDLSWLPVAVVFTGVIPPGVGASIFTIWFVDVVPLGLWL